MAFPRTLIPARVSTLEYPTGLRAPGGTGKWQFRNTGQMGVRWVEEWPPLLAGAQATEALLSYIEWAWSTQQIFDIDHRLVPGSGKSANGGGTGTVLVQGGSQTGSDLVTDGWGGSNPVVRAGDVIKVAGLNQVLRMYEDASHSAGTATLKVYPPLQAGASPADNAAVTRSGVLFRAFIEEKPRVPTAAPHEYLAGLRLVFREAP